MFDEYTEHRLLPLDILGMILPQLDDCCLCLCYAVCQDYRLIIDRFQLKRGYPYNYSPNVQTAKVLVKLKYPVPQDFARVAARKSDLESVKFARSIQCCWDGTNGTEPQRNPINVCSIAALYGSFEIFVWARSQGCYVGELSWENAARSGNFQIFNFLHSAKGKKPVYVGNVCAAAAEGGQLKMLQHLLSLGYPSTPSVGYLAAQNGLLEILEWLQDHDPLFKIENLYEYAGRGGQIHVLAWCIGHTPLTDSNIRSLICIAFKMEHPEILDWLVDLGVDVQNCPTVPQLLISYSFSSTVEWFDPK
jgi:hypothetical protein